MSEQIVGWRATGEERIAVGPESHFENDGSITVLRSGSRTQNPVRIAAPVYAVEADPDHPTTEERLLIQGKWMADVNRQLVSLRLQCEALESATSTGLPIDGPPTSPWRKCPECGAEWDSSFVGMCPCRAKPKAIPAPSPVTVHVSTPATAKVEAGENYGERVAKALVPTWGAGVREEWRRETERTLSAALNAARADGLAARTVPDKEALVKIIGDQLCESRHISHGRLADAILALLTPEPPHAT